MQKDFKNLINTLKNSIKTWDYFVNWNKVFKNSSELEIILNKLNYLLGKDDIGMEFEKLYKDSPEIVKAFPVLLAVRENKLEIFDLEDRNSDFFDFTKSGSDKNDFQKYYEFLEKSGLINLFKSDGIKNLVDYVIGVEVGLDSNGRKNRGGKIMEEIVGRFLDDFCSNNGFECISQATATDIWKKWQIKVNVDKSERSFDFAVYNSVTGKLKLFETNFYNGGGSKLKAVCGEFRVLYDELKSQGIDFIWITDGYGWHTTKRPLEETYNHNEYVFNLDMIEKGSLGKLNW